MAANTSKFPVFSQVKPINTSSPLLQPGAKTSTPAATSKTTSSQTVVAFQNMLTINIDEVRKFGTSNFVRVGIYSRTNRKYGLLFQNSFGVIDQNASPFCSEDSLLEVQPPREHKLAFLAEEYGRNSGKKFNSEATFDFTRLGNQILGQVKAWRVLMGFRNIGSALRPKGSPAKTGYYLEFSLPEVTIANKKLQGVIQGLNTKVYDVKNLEQDFGCAVPESVLMSCFSTPKSLRTKPYNPLSNDVLNLGKNLFDFESMIHVGHLSDHSPVCGEGVL
jgi:hypothetical protein